ncbi:MAG TPA: NUDIX domain-containing protein [Methylococcaceae bacterium]|jgi:isopentenyldiphosphate isomerase|nr:NUDIX domain-containing protein [Methylococcaceae bacterium]HIA44378.1 NUDIX domain-containing protein [Methylococcaceae bacterium]HIB62102.1 NUDIX domain-containing protein [Methylococcaceae bacterium]HIN67980.1 NUDIX domain-containing protein [Methylococcales bacterium]HIO12067.1 NUDIX domain-containing protein [Methylococcales bacterium]
MKKEQLAVVDEQDKVIEIRDRDEIHRLGLRHRAVHILIFNQKQELFLQKRSHKKDINAGLWDSSAAGHVDAGEEYKDCITREVHEELGVTLNTPPELLFKLSPSYENGMEFIHVYCCQHNGPFMLCRDEIDQGQWVSSAKISQLVAENAPHLTATFKSIWKPFMTLSKPSQSEQIHGRIS